MATTLRHWPLFGLRLRTPRLELRLPSLADLDELLVDVRAYVGSGLTDDAALLAVRRER